MTPLISSLQSAAMTNAERRIRAAAAKLAAQTGGEFVVNASKLRDYRTRERARP